MIPGNFTAHIVFDKLEQLKQTLSIENANEKTGIENFAFFETVHLFVSSRLKIAIPILVQEPELASLASEIEAGTVQINTFLGNNNSGHLTNAGNNFNSALTRVRNLPMPLGKSDFDFSKIVSSFQSTVKNAYEKLEIENKKSQDDLKVIQDELTVKNNQVAALQQQLVAKETEIQNVLTAYNTEFEIIKTTNNSTFETEKKKFNDNIEVDRKFYKDKFEADSETNKKTFEEYKIGFENQSSEVVKNLNAKLSEANKIVNIVGNVGVTGNYQKIANQHEGSADFFRWVALGFMVVMSGLLIWSIIELSNGDFNLYKSLVRILAAAVLTYPAVYASRESNKHRILGTQNRNLELELASIGPFIELLPEDKKQKIKEELVNKYFGNNNSIVETKTDDEDISINGLEKLLKVILPFIKK
jgi:hypothetical protein